MFFYRLRIAILCFWILLFSSTSGAAAGWELIFEDNFEQGLKATNWIVNGDGVMLTNREGGGKCIKITRQDEIGETYLIREFQGPGRYKFEALIYSDKVRGGGPTWKAGQFNAAIVEQGREIAWPKDEFQDSFGFTRKVFETPNLSSNRKAKLRIGIQDGTGSIFIADVKVFKWSE